MFSRSSSSSISRYLNMNDDEAADQVFGLCDGLYRSQCLYTVCDLGIPDIIVNSRDPISVNGILERLDQDVDAGLLTRVLRYVALHGVFHEVASEDGKLLFAPTKITEYLSRSNPVSDSPFVQHVCSPYMSHCAISIHRLVRKEIKGSELFKTLHGQELWDYFKNNETERAIFQKYLEIHSAKMAPALTALAAEVHPGRVVVDIGGGSGQLMKMLKDINPDLRCVNFDLPEVILQCGIIDGVEMAAGDMLATETIPKADVVVMKHVLHDWDDLKCQEILLACRQALPERGKLICIDSVLEDPGNGDPVKGYSFNLDLRMMTIFGSKERHLAEWKSIFKGGGFELDKCVSAKSPGNDFKLLVAHKVD